MLADNIEIMHLEVGGLRFSLLSEDITKHPECLFATLAKREWRQNQEESIKIDRDGRLFRYVYIFIITGYIPKEILSSSELEGLSEEANYFNLPDLAHVCDVFRDNGNFTDHIKAYKGVQRYCESDNFNNDNVTIDYEKEESAVLKAVNDIPNQISVFHSQNETSFCIHNELYNDFIFGKKMQIYKSSSTHKLNIKELVKGATPSPFGHGPHTVFDTNVRNSLEIPASALNQKTMEQISNAILPEIHWCMEDEHLQLRPYKLVIYQEGGHFEAHRDTVRGEGHIGTLVLILDSEYTGGELEIAHGGYVQSVTGSYHWAAMYGDCFHRILPVTSGTRVSLLFDIYLAPGGCLRPSADISTLRAEQAQLVAAVQAELQSYEAVSICLEHMYPAAQAVPGYLKGCDGVLFALLQESFTVEVVHATVLRTLYYEDHEEYDQDEPAEKIRIWFIRSFLQHTNASAYNKLRIKFVIPGNLQTKTLLNREELNYTGNESDGEQNVYCATALLIRRDSIGKQSTRAK